MIRQIAAAFALALQLIATTAWAADNAIVLTPGTGVVERSKDVGSGVQSVIVILGDTSGNALATAPGTGNSSFALPIQGVSGGINIPVILNAETTKVIGEVNQGTSPWVVSNGGTFAVQATLQASGTTAIGKVDPNTIATWGLTPIGGTTSSPTNAFLSGCEFLSSPPTYTTGNSGAVQCTAAGSVHTTVDNTNANGSATSANSSPVVIASDQAAVATKAASGAFASGAFATGSQVDLLTIIGTKAAGTAAASSALVGGIYTSTAPTLTTGQQAAVQVSARGGVLSGSQYPAGSTPITVSATGTTGATTATLATGASVTTYICWMSIRANATAAATGNATVTGTITGTLNFTQWTAPLASGLGVTEMVFNPCVPASAVNTGIAVVSAAPGSGGTVSVSAGGYTL
jgi:hypothetical protein